MSGPFGSSQWMYSSGVAGFYPHNVNQSLRFEDGDNPYLSKTLSGSSGTIFTFSCWVKLGNLSINRCLLQGYADGSNFAQIVLYSGNYIGMYSATSGTARLFAYTQALQRDPSAWYNIVVKFNGTLGSEEFKIYVNGENQTLTTSTSLSAHQSNIGKNNAHYIGNNFNQSLDMDGYFAEVNFIDGTALDADSFGETKAGIWIPKDTSGLTFGTNGFRLKFQNSSSIGDDTSGNNNDFTATNLAATDVVLDNPSNNWCTINPLSSRGTQSQGNLKTVTEASGYSSTVGSMGHTTGKWYWEVVPTSAVTGGPLIGVVDETYDSTNSGSAVGYLLGNDGVDSIAYYFNGNKYINGTGSSYGASYTTDDIIGVALNLDDNEITFYKNNASQGTISHTFSGNNILPAVSDASNTSSTITFIFNFGQDSSFAGAETAQGNADSNGVGDFYYSPPSGFLALCAANLPNPAIDPAEDEEPADHFNTVLYSGDGSSSQSITGVGFEPAWTWIKSRGNAYAWHALIDSVRGVTKFLYSNVYNTENTSSAPFKSFNIDGFSVGSDTSTARTNVSGETYVAWNWLASTSVSGSTSGAGTSKSYSGKSNTTSGFSIIAYPGNGTSGHDVPHHLGVKPEMIITKSRNYSYDWMIYHKDIPTTYSHPPYIEWNETAAAVTSSQMFEEPTSSYMGLYSNGAINRNGGNHISYCFASKDGYSRVGSYTGNGSTDGPFVYTGFRVAWLMIKRTNSTADWIVFDSKRDVDNEITQFLYPNASYAEATGSGVLDFLSNGFKLRGSTANRNASGSHYIFLCFAEQPFKYSNAR